MCGFWGSNACPSACTAKHFTEPSSQLPIMCTYTHAYTYVCVVNVHRPGSLVEVREQLKGADSLVRHQAPSPLSCPTNPS